MVIHVYSIVRNDEYILPYFLRHYSIFADKIFIIDDHSTDNTREVATSFPKVELLNFEYNRGFNEDDFNNTLESSYKKHSRGIADWVMCVDSDEFIYHKDIINVLQEQCNAGSQVLKTDGYTMVSEKNPDKDGQIYDECKMGMRTKQYDKTVVFNPKIDITFGHGRHITNIPKGIEVVDVGLLLLHYRYLSKEYFIKRSNHLYDRAGYDDKTRKYRMKRGLSWYDRSLKSNLIKVI